MIKSALIDGATIHSTGALFERLSKKLAIRPINILSLSALIDAYIMFEELTVPADNWNYFAEHAPRDWITYLNDVTNPTTIQFKKIDTDSFISNPLNYWAFQGMLGSDMDLYIYHDYRSYVGGDFGLHKDGDEVDEIEKCVIKYWTLKDEQFNWDYHSSDVRHIDPIHAVWRGCQYSQYASDNNHIYVPHELRGRFLEVHKTLAGNKHSDPVVNIFLEHIKNIINDLALSNNELANKLVSRHIGDNFIWNEVSIPLFSALALQRSATIYEIFDQAYKLRNNTREFRYTCQLLEDAISDENMEKSSSLLLELEQLTNEFHAQHNTPTTSWSFSLTYPWSIGVGYTPKSMIYQKHTNFIRDLYQCRLLPLTFKSDLIRIFGYGQDPSHWFESYGRKPIK